MEKSLESYLKTLCSKAREVGASEAVAISAADIVVDERVRLKCLVPVCSFYGRNLMCPPNVMSIPEFKSVLKGYHGAILIGTDPILPRPPEKLESLSGLSEAWKTTKPAINGEEQQSTTVTEYFHTLRDDWERLDGVIGYIESLCISQGYPFAAGLSAGGCLLCDECAGYQAGVPCRHPFKARPSMEAMGINVVATARKAGLHVGFALGEPRRWVGLILVD
jgi:predicted metal-binding protein